MRVGDDKESPPAGVMSIACAERGFGKKVDAGLTGPDADNRSQLPAPGHRRDTVADAAGEGLDRERRVHPAAGREE